MIKKPAGYDAAQAVKVGESQYIQPGWYPAVVCNVAQGSTPNGTDFLEFWIDITDGEYVRYYKRDYLAQNKNGEFGEKKWHGTVRYFMSEKALPMLKGGITAIEDSNPGYVFDWNEESVKGKKVGVGIRREEFEDKKTGETKSTTRPFAFCDIKKVIAGEMETPKDKLLKPSAPTAPSYGYTPSNMTPPGYTTPGTSDPYHPTNPPGFEELGSDEELPF